MEAPVRHAIRCCGRSDFVIGTLTYGFLNNPETQYYGREESGAIVACCHCGKRYGVNADGIYTPHEDAMPGPWALEQVRRRAESEPRKAPLPIPKTAFRRPPRGE